MLSTIRKSFRRKKKRPPPATSDSNRPAEWKLDEEAVKNSRCSFPVKYLGQVEVQESRGMHVCEGAVKTLKSEIRKNRMPSFFGRGKKKKIKAMLYVTPDALRVVEDSTKALLLDQTIEKVSFCAPDRNYDRAFSYICRDGTTRRWLCHSFFATKESGERLSHAVGCAFAQCLEKKQKREKEGVSATYENNGTTFAREGSFKVKTLTEQAAENKALRELSGDNTKEVKVDVHNLKSVPRPHAPAHLVRQASMRPLSHKNRFKEGQESLQTPFKRNMSLQIGKLPSNMARCEVMNPVPEVDEEVHNDVTKGNLFADDPFASAPMPKNISQQLNKTSPVMKPVLLHNQPSNQMVSSSLQQPTATTNPWQSNGHQRTPSQADEWLKQIMSAQQTQPPAINQHPGYMSNTSTAFQFSM